MGSILDDPLFRAREIDFAEMANYTFRGNNEYGRLDKEEAFYLIVSAGFKFSYEIERDAFDCKRMIFFGYPSDTIEVSYKLDGGQNNVCHVLHVVARIRERWIFDYEELITVLREYASKKSDYLIYSRTK